MEPQKCCRMRGWSDLRFYEEQMSGAATSRPGLDRLVQDMRAGGIERLVFYKLDRLGRSVTHLALILDEMNRLGIPLICSSQGIDTSDDFPCGKFQLAVLMAVAEFERGIIRERVRAGLATASDQSRPSRRVMPGRAKCPTDREHGWPRPDRADSGCARHANHRS
jgi:DNA invertase Pin-like site-specific DNA recombinase